MADEAKDPSLSGISQMTASIKKFSATLGTWRGRVQSIAGQMDGWFVEPNAQLEVFESRLANSMRDAVKAGETMRWAVDFSAGSPFPTLEVAEAAAQLQAFGLTARRTLGNVGDMAAVTGKPLSQAVDAVTAVQAGEIKQLEAFGITKQKLLDMSNRRGGGGMSATGEVTDLTAFNATLFAVMDEQFRGGMGTAARTFRGMETIIANFADAAQRELTRPVFQALEAGLARIVDWIGRFKSGGGLEALATVGRALGDALGATLSWLAESLQRVAVLATLLWPSVQPVFSWLVNTALPPAVGLIAVFGGWVLKVADFFIANWSWIAPLVQGVALAFGMVLGPLYALIGAITAWSIAGQTVLSLQTAWNASLLSCPIFWLIAGVGLLIGAAILLIQNWEQVKLALGQIWAGLVQEFAEAYAGWAAIFTELGSFLAAFFADLGSQALNWGAAIIDMLVQGIITAKDRLVGAVLAVFAEVRKFLPSSDAQEGPFSQLTHNGGQIMATLAEGVEGRSGRLKASVGGALAEAGVDVNPAGNEGFSAGAAKTVTVGALIGTLHLNDVGTKDASALVDEIITHLYARLSEAANIAAAAEKGALL
ncbi:MAG TPA: hypothetical protein PKA10_10080 [Selenomonadales bacterium]|nr:hypothetical protein [Selenomonadales bacterium]